MVAFAGILAGAQFFYLIIILFNEYGEYDAKLKSAVEIYFQEKKTHQACTFNIFPFDIFFYLYIGNIQIL